MLASVQLVWISSSNFPKGLHQFALLPTVVPFVPALVTTSPFHFSHSGGAGATLYFDFSTNCWQVCLFFDLGMNLLSFPLVAEILLSQFLLKVIHPTGNLLTSSVSSSSFHCYLSLAVAFSHFCTHFAATSLSTSCWCSCDVRGSSVWILGVLGSNFQPSLV